MGLKGWGATGWGVAGGGLAGVALLVAALLLLAPESGGDEDDLLHRQLCGLAEIYAGILGQVAAAHEAGGSPQTAAPLLRRIAAVDRLCGPATPEATGSVAPLSYSK